MALYAKLKRIPGQFIRDDDNTPVQYPHSGFIIFISNHESEIKAYLSYPCDSIESKYVYPIECAEDCMEDYTGENSETFKKFINFMITNLNAGDYTEYIAMY